MNAHDDDADSRGDPYGGTDDVGDGALESAALRIPQGGL